jgi:hypothetical protein
MSTCPETDTIASTETGRMEYRPRSRPEGSKLHYWYIIFFSVFACVFNSVGTDLNMFYSCEN